MESTCSHKCRQCLRYYSGNCKHINKEKAKTEIELNELDMQVIALFQEIKRHNIQIQSPSLSEYTKRKCFQKLCNLLHAYDHRLFPDSTCNWITHFQGLFSHHLKWSIKKVEKLDESGQLNVIGNKDKLRVHMERINAILEKNRIHGWSPLSIMEESISLWVPHPFALMDALEFQLYMKKR